MNQNQVVTLDGAKLKRIGQASHTAEVTMTDLAMRERLRHFSDIVRTKNKLVRSGEKIVDSDYMAFWKGLQDAGVGSIVYGRRGKPDRFEWHYSLKQVAKAALEGTDEAVEKISIAPRVKQKVTPKQERKSKENQENQQSRSIYIPLRSNLDLELPVPKNGFSEEEVEAVNRAMRKYLS